MASAEEPRVLEGIFHAEDLELALANMTVEDLSLKVGAATDSGVNTDADWESQLAEVFSHNSILKEQLEVLMKQQQDETEQCNKEMQKALSKQEAAKQEHKAVLQKLDSVRVKLQLNNSKATIKNFLANKEKMILERNKENETIMRLNDELDDSCRKLQDLTKEQLEEKKKWQDELAVLKQQMEQLKEETEEAQRLALQDEVAAVEKQKDVAMAQIQEWQKELEQYLNILSMEMPKRYYAERQQWEKKQDLVRQTQMELQSRFEEVLQQLHQGHELDFLSRIRVPELPPIPMAELKSEQIRNSLVTPVFRVPLAPPPPMMHVPHGHFHPPRPLHFHPAPNHPSHYMPPTPLRFVPPPHPHAAQFPPMPPPSPIFSRSPARATPPPSISPSPPPQLINPPAPSTPPAKTADAPAAAGKQDKLDKVLEKLGSHFPECTKAQLKLLLQQVKNSRGTLAGMSMDEVVVQVRLRLAKNEGSGPASQPPQGFETRRLCLMCQNLVDPEQRHPLVCSHTVHRDCIRTWLETSKNNSCPFCK